MAGYHEETLVASELLIERGPGQRGRLPAARIRRSISTTYYALFHFLLEECATRLVGTGPRHLRRRRLFTRVLTHRGMKLAFVKVQGRNIDRGMQDYFGVEEAPAFARRMAVTFLSAQDQRTQADYDLNASLSELDARILIRSARRAIRAWNRADRARHRDFKNALCLLLTAQGRLRRDEG